MKRFLCLAGLLWVAPLALLAADQQPLKWARGLRVKPGWFTTPEGRAAADNVVRYQSVEGGWPKNTDLFAPITDEALAELQRGGKANTIDNQATTSPIQFLAAAYAAARDERYRAAVERGLDYLLASQYPNGGFPQFFPLRPGYYSHITFNDGAMINVLELLHDVGAARRPFGFIDGPRRARAAEAVVRGIACILKTQIKQDGRLTAWCAQYDEQTLAPAWARKYEPPSLSGAESVGIVRFLMAIPRPPPAVVAAIEGAVAWFRAVPITGRRLAHVPTPGGKPDVVLVADPAAPPLWARFYELGTHRPIFMGRDSVVHYRMDEIEHERRIGYGWYGNTPAKLLESQRKWRAAISRSTP